jgi:hypothetical protein
MKANASRSNLDVLADAADQILAEKIGLECAIASAIAQEIGDQVGAGYALQELMAAQGLADLSHPLAGIDNAIIPHDLEVIDSVMTDQSVPVSFNQVIGGLVVPKQNSKVVKVKQAKVVKAKVVKSKKILRVKPLNMVSSLNSINATNEKGGKGKVSSFQNHDLDQMMEEVMNDSLVPN